MSIISYIDLFVGAVINLIFYIFVVVKVFDEKIRNKKSIVILNLLIASFFVTIINVFNKDIFKVLLTFPFGIMLFKNTFLIDYKKSIIYLIITTLFMFVGEIMTAFIFSLLPFDYTFIFNHILGTTTGAIIVSIFTLPALYLKKLKKLINKIVNSINEKSKMIITIILVIAIGALTYRNTTGTNNIFNIIMNIAVIITLFSILYIYYIENMKSQELSKSYNIMFNYLEKYEKELTEKRKIIHDYKNQLIIIRGYIGENKKLKEYVDEIINDQKLVKENSIIKNIDLLPKGLKGLIYYKFSQVEDIDINLKINTKLDKFDKLSPKLNKQILKIIGILIDNAIEATSEEERKYIDINMSIKKDVFNIEIINSCDKKINKKNLMEVGFSTKGKNRGYGLSLVQDILKQEKVINLSIDVKDNEFISNLKVKIQ